MKARTVAAMLLGLAAATPALAEPMRVEIQNATSSPLAWVIAQTNGELAVGGTAGSDQSATAAGFLVKRGERIVCHGTASHTMISTATATFPSCSLNVTAGAGASEVCLKEVTNSYATPCVVKIIVAGP